MRVSVSGFTMAESAQSLDDRVLRFGLAGVDDVVDFGNVAKVGMVFCRAGVRRRGGDPAIVIVGITKKLAIAEVAPQQAKLPHVVRNVFAHVADRAVRADDHFLIFFGNFVSL